MTPEQLDHLTKLKAHLESLLATAAKRTPGEWGVEQTDTTNWIGPMRHNGDGKISIIVCDTNRDGLRAECIDQSDSDAAFIAACAGNAEAGWRSTLISIEWALFMHNNNQVGEGLIDKILTAWPISTLSPND